MKLTPDEIPFDAIIQLLHMSKYRMTRNHSVKYNIKKNMQGLHKNLEAQTDVHTLLSVLYLPFPISHSRVKGHWLPWQPHLVELPLHRA